MNQWYLKAGHLPRFFFIVAALSSAPLRAEPETSVYSRIEVFGHAEPVAISEYVGEWRGSLQKGSDAITHNRFETGAQWRAWQLAYVQNYDYEIKANRDTAELYHRIRNRQGFAVGEQFDLDLQAWHARSQGLRLGRILTIAPALTVNVGASLLDAQRLIDGRIQGSATAVAEREYQYQAQVDYSYSKDAIFNRNTPAPDGWGWALDASVSGQWQAWHWQLTGQNLLGNLYWSDAPFARATATSATQSTDDDGFTVFAPNLSGVEGNHDFTQRLHARGNAELQYQWQSQTGPVVGYRMTEVRNYVTLAWQQALTQQCTVRGNWMPEVQALGAAVDCYGLSFAWLADHLQPQKAHVLALTLGFSYRF